MNEFISTSCVSTCMLHISGSVSVSHGINVHKLLLKYRQEEGEAIVQTDIQDELIKRKVEFNYNNIILHIGFECHSYNFSYKLKAFCEQALLLNTGWAMLSNRYLINFLLNIVPHWMAVPKNKKVATECKMC